MKNTQNCFENMKKERYYRIMDYGNGNRMFKKECKNKI